MSCLGAVVAVQVVVWQFCKADFASMPQMEQLITSYIRRQRDGESAEALGFAKHVSAFSTYLEHIRAETDPNASKLPRTLACLLGCTAEGLLRIT